MSQGVSKYRAGKLIAKAKEHIALAAVSDTREEIGRARIQLENLYNVALQDEDVKTALAARKELSKILHLYELTNTSALDEEMQTMTETLVRQHLEGLDITDKGLPLEELARSVALWVIGHADYERDAE